MYNRYSKPCLSPNYVFPPKGSQCSASVEVLAKLFFSVVSCQVPEVEASAFSLFVCLFHLREGGHPGKWWLKHAPVLCREIMLSCVQLNRRKGEVFASERGPELFPLKPMPQGRNAFHRLDCSFSKPGWEVHCGTWGKSRARLSSRICS